jgi:ribosomal protein S18 acetylase RimI-like enzyme
MIRLAQPSDAPAVASLLVQVMNELACRFVGSTNPYDALPLFEYFVQIKNNQYSHENTLVYEDASGVVGSINAYDGAKLIEYRAPFLMYLNDNYGFRDILEEETTTGEFYLDTLGVKPDHQGKGIGTSLIRAACDRGKQLGHSRAGLLVDETNPLARKLYERVGFSSVGPKNFAGGIFAHMVREL